MKRLILSLTILSILALPSVARPTTYYVSSGGSGNGLAPGTSAAPGFANTTDFANGDVIVVKANSIYATTITLAATIAGDGVTGLTIRGSQAADGDWGDGTADVEDDGPPDWNGNTGGGAKPFDINGTSAYKIASLTLKDLSGHGQSFLATKDSAFDLEYINGLVLDNVDYNGHTDWSGTTYGKNLIGITRCKGTIEVKNSTIQNAGPISVATTGPSADPDAVWRDYIGIAVQYCSVAGTTISIYDNTIHNVNADSIQIYRSTAAVSVYNNTSYDNGENFVDVKGSKNVTIYNNVAYREVTFTGSMDNSVGSLIHIHDSGIYTVDNVIVRDNHLYDNPDYDAVRIFSGEADTLSKNVYVYRNKIQNCGGGIYVKNMDGVQIYRNLIFDTPTDGYFVYVQQTTGYSDAPSSGYAAKFYGNTFVANSQISKGVSAQRSPAGYFLFKNNVFYVNYNGTAYLVDADDATKPIFIDNIFFNAYADNQDIIEWNGTAYDESELATWEALDAATLNSNAFGDPGLNSVPYDQLWAAATDSAVINTGADISTEIPGAVNGLSSTATWTAGAWTSSETVNAADNGGIDRGAYELSSEPTPVPIGGAAPTGTYLLAWNGDYTDDVSMGWSANGVGTHDGTVAAGVEVSGAHGVTGNGARFSAANENIEWTDTGGDTINPSEGIVWLSLYIESLNAGNTEFFHVYQDGNNEIYAYFESDGGFTLRHEGQGTIVSVITSSGVVSASTQYTIGLRWSVSNNQIGYKIGAADWVNDADDDAVTAFAAGTRYVSIGESARSSAVGFANPTKIDNFSVDDAWNTAQPDWTPSDVTAPTITARGVCSDASCTACTTDLTAAYVLDDSFRVCGAVSEDVIVNEPPDWTFVCGTVTIDPSYFEKKEIGGVKYLTASTGPISAKTRCTDPTLIEMTNYSGIVDGSGNVLDPTGSAGVFSTGTITIGAAGDWTIGTFTDEDSNEYQGEYTTPAAFYAAVTAGNVAGDALSVGTFTGTFDATGAGTALAPITVTLSGSSTVATGAWTLDQNYWIVDLNGGNITGAVTVSGAGVEIYNGTITGSTVFGAKLERCKLN